MRAKFYTSVFKDSKIVNTSYYGEAGYEYTKGLGAVELRRWSHDDSSIRVAELSIDGAVFHLHEENSSKGYFEPNSINGITITIGLFVSNVDDMDFRVGGTSFVYMHSPDFGTLCNTWTYTKIAPKEQIEFTLRWADEEGNNVSPVNAGVQPGLPHEVPHVITIKDMGNGQSELTVSEFGYATEEMVQMSKAGLVDEIQIDLIPVLLGDGIRLFEQLGTEPVELERTKVIEAPGVTHLRYVVKE